jgi:hypothetical protein
VSAVLHPSPRLAASPLYATPRRGVALEDCWFYHTMDLPGHGTVEGLWDLRRGIADYVGPLAYQGQRVLEFGTASGAVTFALEQRGAEVVSFDLARGAPWDIVPLASCPDLRGPLSNRQAQLERLRNSYWFAHEALSSGARAVYGNIYQVPADIGSVDTCFYGAILLHLRDPLLALANGARLAQGAMVVTERLDGPWTPFLARGRASLWQRARRKAAYLWLRGLRWLTPYAHCTPQMVLLPDPHNQKNLDTWWALSPALIQQFLAVLGFEEATSYTHQQTCQGRRQTMFTVVARRTRPMPSSTSSDGPFPWY